MVDLRSKFKLENLRYDSSNLAGALPDTFNLRETETIMHLKPASGHGLYL